GDGLACFGISRGGPMTRTPSLVTAFGLLAAGTLASLPAAGQTPEFEVASIKRNTTNQLGSSGPPPSPATGTFSMINVPARTIILRAYPLQILPIQVLGLPSWAESERYDIVAKGKAGATTEEQQQM